MADAARKGSVQSYSAPYLHHPEELIVSANEFPNIVYFRSGDQTGGRQSTDVFSVGDFKETKVPWESGGQTDLLDARQRLTDELANPDVLLAGYLSYEYGFSSEAHWQDLRVPTEGNAWRLLNVPYWYEADHTNKLGWICSSAGADVDNAFLEIINSTTSAKPKPPKSIRPFNLDLMSQFAEMSQSDYCSRIASVLEDIMAGRYYELNLTQRFARFSSAGPIDVFLEIFRKYRPARGFFGKFQDELIGSCSPELFIRRSGESVFTRPIKGSFSETTTASEREKLHAEHVMVVDLARNDFGRISDLSPVSVSEFMVENEFGGLQHLESMVYGETSMSLGESLPHLLPAASITGAPKVEVVSAISEYELSPRGVYTGACGGFWPNGDADLNVGIRTFRATRDHLDWKYEFGAGGAIVADSVPQQEYVECLKKAWPLVAAITACE